MSFSKKALLVKTLIKRLWSAGATKWIIVCQIITLVLPAVIMLEANQLKFPLTDVKAVWVAGIAYLATVIWIIKGKSKKDEESGWFRSILVWLLTKPLTVTLIAIALLGFSAHLWKRVCYFDLSDTERKTLTNWSDSSLQTLGLLEEDTLHWETDFQAVSDLEYITFGSFGSKSGAQNRELLSKLHEGQPVAIEMIKQMRNFCKEIGTVARFEPKGNLFGEYKRRIEPVAMEKGNSPNVAGVDELFDDLGTQIMQALPLREQATTILSDSTPTKKLLSLLEEGVLLNEHLLTTRQERYVQNMVISNRSTNTEMNPKVLEGLGAFYISQTVNKMIDRHKRNRLLLSDLSLLTEQLEQRLRTGSISSQDSREFEERLRAVRNSILQ
jgi:hypothetical protein